MKKATVFLSCLYFFSCPLEFVLNRLFGSSVKYIGLAVAASVLLFFLLNRQKTIHIGRLQICLLVFAALQAASLLWTNYNSYTLPRLTGYLEMALLVLLLSIFPFERKDLTALVRAYTLGCVILALLVVFFGKMDGGYNSAGRLTISFLGAYLDPNNLASILLTGIFFCFHQIFQKHGRSPYINILCAVLFVLQVVALFFTGSRGGLIALAVSLFAYLLLRAKKKNLPLLIVLSLAALVLCIQLLPHLLPQTLYDRLFDFQQYTDGSGRLTIWAGALRQILYRPLLGYGIASYFDFINGAMHNTYIAVLFELGLAGFVLFMIPLCTTLFRAIRSRELGLVAIMLSNMAAAFFLDTLHVRFFWNALLLGILFYEILHREQLEEDRFAEHAPILTANTSV